MLTLRQRQPSVRVPDHSEARDWYRCPLIDSSEAGTGLAEPQSLLFASTLDALEPLLEELELPLLEPLLEEPELPLPDEPEPLLLELPLEEPELPLLEPLLEEPELSLEELELSSPPPQFFPPFPGLSGSQPSSLLP